MPGPDELSESETGRIAHEVRKQLQYAVPHRAYVTRVYEHITPGDEWNHEVDVVLLSELADHNREFEVPVATGAAGDVALPNDIKRNFDLADRPDDPDFDAASAKTPTEKDTAAKPDSNRKNDDDRPECLVAYVGGDPDAPVVTDWLYSDENRAPISRVNDRYFTVGDAEFGSRADADDNQTVRLGFVGGDGDAIQPGIVITPNSTPQILDPNGTDVFAATQEAAAGGGAGSAGDGSGVLPDTNPGASPADRASAAGISVSKTKTISSVSEIDSSNTLYIVEAGATLTHNGKVDAGTLHDVAICGESSGGDNPALKISSGYRDNAFVIAGQRIMWSGIDLDQTATGARARLNFQVENGGFYESFKTIGSGKHPNADPSSSYPETADGQATLTVPATSSKGTVRVKDVSLIHGGVGPNTHEKSYPIGIFLADHHRGTLNIVDSQIEEYPNNGVYASACPGAVNATGSRFYNNAVAQFRVARGTIEDCTVGYDYQNSGMANADAPGHGIDAIASEQKKSGAGGSVDVKDCTVEWLNVAKTRGAVNTYDIHGTGHYGTIDGCDITVNNASGAAHINIGGVCRTITNTTFRGGESSGACIVNDGPAIKTSGLRNETSRVLVTGPTN